MSSKPKEFWDHLKKLNNKLKSSNNNTIPADVWVDHFSSLNKKDPSMNPQVSDYCKNVESEVNSLLSDRIGYENCVLDKPFLLSEIKWGLTQLKMGKFGGLDGVSNDILIICSKKIAPSY